MKPQTNDSRAVVTDKSGAHNVGEYTQADLDRARADGYNDGFRQGKQSRAAAPSLADAIKVVEDCEYENVAVDVILQRLKSLAATTPPIPSDAAMRAVEDLKSCIDPFFMLNRDWKSEVAAIIARHLAATPARDFQKRLFDECVTAKWDPKRKNTFAEEIAHLHEELSEAFRAWRRYKDCEIRVVNGKLEGVPIEFADALIGMFYNAELYGFDLFAAIETKHQFNLTRNYVQEGRQLHAAASTSPETPVGGEPLTQYQQGYQDGHAAALKEVIGRNLQRKRERAAPVVTTGDDEGERGAYHEGFDDAAKVARVLSSLTSGPEVYEPDIYDAVAELRAKTGNCLLCGHHDLDADGMTCAAPVPICSDASHGLRHCGCHCQFTTAALRTKEEEGK